jgi:hypothetical protein
VPMECDRRIGALDRPPNGVTGYDKKHLRGNVAGSPPWGPEGAALSEELTQKWTPVPFRNNARQNIK